VDAFGVDPLSAGILSRAETPDPFLGVHSRLKTDWHIDLALDADPLALGELSHAL
jgi:hypothetical protein